MRAIALLLTVLTGFSGLVYEVTWEKYLATLLGSHSEATAAVLGLFLGGLALGYAVFGRLTRSLERATQDSEKARSLLLFRYGLLEAGIGVYALLFPYLFQAVQALSFALPHGGGGGAGFVLDVGLAALLIVPPAVLMGGTIPMLTQALSTSLADATRFHALVYAFNTAGAFAGALAAGFWLIPRLGLVGVLDAMAVLNLAAGVTFIVLSRGAPKTTSEAPRGEAEAGTAQPGVIRQFAFVALLSGFAMMSIQTVLIRLGGLSLGASQFTFSMVVAASVLCIALGSFAVSALRRVPAGLLAASLWLLVVLLGLLYTVLDDAPYWTHVLRVRFSTDPGAFFPYHASAFAALLAVIGVPVALAGATLPLIFDHLRNRYGELGDMAGRLYSWNTVGSLLGALLGGYALLFWLDLHHVFRLALAALAVAAALVTRHTTSWRPVPAAIAGALALVVLALLPAWSPEQLAAGLFRYREKLPLTEAGPKAFFEDRKQTFRLLSYDDDPTASVTVGDEPLADGREQRFILTNGKSDGATIADYVTMALAGLVPALLAERAESAFVIGWGTGVSVGSLAEIESMRRIDVAEISPAVMDAAPFFEEANGAALAHPGLSVIQSDAYRALIRSPQRYDVITSEPSNPWVIGVEMLFSREFLEAARDRLTPGGVYAQWFHIYETDAATVSMVLRTYASVFEHVAVWYMQSNDLLLLGLTDPDSSLDLERLAARAARADFAAGLKRAQIDGLPALLAHELLPVGVVHATSMPGEVHTLLHPRLSSLAARAFFTGGEGRLPPTAHLESARVGRRQSLLARYVAEQGGRLPEDQRLKLVEQTCAYRPRECVTLLAHWTHEVPESPARDAVQGAIRGNQGLARVVNPNMVVAMSRFYDPELGPQEPETSGGVDDGFVDFALQVTRTYVDYHHHAAPFSRQALARLWRRCGEEPGRRDRCRQAREAITHLLGDLDVALD